MIGGAEVTALLRMAARTHVGKLRPVNEDLVVLDEAAGVAVVADGMGGEAGGEVAAQMACEVLRLQLRRPETAADPGAIPAAFDAADKAIRARVARDVALDGMGATVAVVRFDPTGGRVQVAHAGDARVYVLRRAPAAGAPPVAAPRWSPPVKNQAGTLLTCVTRDHSSICEMVERGHLTRAAGRAHPLRGRVTRALGRAGAHAPDLLALPLAAGDRLLICTDGLWELVDDPTIARISEGAASCERACELLVLKALENGGRDNVSVAVVDWLGPAAAERPERPEPAQPEPAAPPPPARPAVLERLGRDLTARARRGELDPVIGRDAEILRLARATVGRRRASALLVGDAGVGKTCLVEGLARLIASPACPERLAGARVVELSVASLVAGTRYRGELEERLEAVLREAERDRIILFIDELHTLLGAGSGGDALDAANILKPALARGALRLIGATTTAEFERHVARDEAFTRRFEVIRVAEPSRDEAIAILRGLAPALERYYGVGIEAEALIAAVDLAVRHLPDRRLPDKAIAALDQACTRKLLVTPIPGAPRPPASSAIGRADLVRVIADLAGVPVELVAAGTGERVRTLGDHLARRVIGQDAAIAQVAAAITRAYAGLRAPHRPVASFLFVGPTGVGKSETAKAIAEHLFPAGGLVRLDMSEYGEKHQVARLTGAPPGYVGHDEGGQLTAAVRRNPACVVLFDEIDKAHPDALMHLLQILDEGELTDGQGRKTSFREAIVILTANFAAGPARARPIGLRTDGDEPESEAAGDDALRRRLRDHLRPELVGRIGAVVGYGALAESARRAIAEKCLAELAARLEAQGALPPLPADLIDRVLAAAGDVSSGARDLERIVAAQVGELLARPAAAEQVLYSSIRSGARAELAMLLLDVVASTGLVRELGDTFLADLIAGVIAAVRRHPAASDLRFLKCTGDGLLALFGSVGSALAVARAPLAPERARLRRVIHWGRLRQGEGGEPFGAEVHRLFRVEALREGVPDDRPVLTSGARERLSEDARRGLACAGRFTLEGFVEPIELWTDAPAL